MNQRPPDFAQFAYAFCSEFPDIRGCDPSPPSLEETLAVASLLIPWGALARIGGELAAGAIAGMEGSVEGGGAVAGATAGTLADAGAAANLTKLVAESLQGSKPGLACANSFIGDTKVLMADGTSKPIDQVKVGDEVKNAEPKSDITQRHAVTVVHVTDVDKEFVDVSVETAEGPRTITATANHPFWDATAQSWVGAVELKPHDQLSAPGNARVIVQSVRRYMSSIRTYNLTIAGVHTYFVLAGSVAVLVHNTMADCSDAIFQTVLHNEQEILDGNLNHLIPGMDSRTAAGADRLADYLEEIQRTPGTPLLNGSGEAWYDPRMGLYIYRGAGASPSGSVFEASESYFASKTGVPRGR